MDNKIEYNLFCRVKIPFKITAERSGVKQEIEVQEGQTILYMHKDNVFYISNWTAKLNKPFEEYKENLRYSTAFIHA